MEYSSSHLLNRITVASSAMSAILNLPERRVDAVKSGSLRCADEFKQQENKSSENVRRQATCSHNNLQTLNRTITLISHYACVARLMRPFFPPK